VINQGQRGGLETGAVASLLVALVSVSAARSAAVLHAARDMETLGLDSEWTAYSAASLVLPAALIASLIGAAATGVLVGADLGSAREFGLAVAVGLLIDVALLRPAQVATLARWGSG
jgi:uncharacterized membrane protein YdfJ with MMPL/SSD domain